MRYVNRTGERLMLQHHQKVLAALYDLTHPHGEHCVGFAPLARETGMHRAEVRRVTRHLARKGLAEYHKALFTDEGELAGAGYCITPAGRDLMRARDPELL